MEQCGWQLSVTFLFALQRTDQLGERSDAGEWEPVGIDVADTGLIRDRMRQIGQREALGFQFPAIDATGKCHGLVS